MAAMTGIVRWVGLGSLTLLWVGLVALIGLWYMATPLGIAWGMAWGWIEADAGGLAGYNNVVLLPVLEYVGMLLVLHWIWGVWPFHGLDCR
jgi:hypothetical protein